MKKIYILILLSFISGLLISCQTTPQLTRYQAQFLDVFDTASTIVGYASDQASYKAKMETIKADFLEYDKLFDIYNNYDGINNLKTINDMAGKSPVEVDPAIIELLIEAKEMYVISDGHINIAFGNVLSIWHDYREAAINDPQNASYPPLEVLKAATTHCNIDDIIIDREKNTVFLKDPAMRLDVGAIAKGYGIDRVAEQQLSENKDPHLLFSIGGNIRTVGSKPNEEGWIVGIQNPDNSSEQTTLLRLKLTAGAIATSGDYQRYFTVNGIRYHHIINKDTLMPSNYFSAVSVICDSATRADALSTALFNMDYQTGRTLVEKLDNVDALWVFKDQQQKMTDGFAERIID